MLVRHVLRGVARAARNGVAVTKVVRSLHSVAGVAPLPVARSIKVKVRKLRMRDQGRGHMRGLFEVAHYSHLRQMHPNVSQLCACVYACMSGCACSWGGWLCVTHMPFASVAHVCMCMCICVTHCQSTVQSRSFSSYPAHQLLKMPSLSPTMTKGNIVEWKKKVGDKVSPGEVYCTVRVSRCGCWRFVFHLICGSSPKLSVSVTFVLGLLFCFWSGCLVLVLVVVVVGVGMRVGSTGGNGQGDCRL